MEYDEDCDGAFCNVFKKFGGKSLQHSKGVWISTPFNNWKKAIERMKAHERSIVHASSSQAALTAEETLREGSVLQQLQKADR